MQHSERSQEGYFLLNHRNSPGLSPELMRRFYPELPAGAGRELVEAPAITCTHCQRGIVLNPKRTRRRERCWGCHRRICDLCYGVLVETGTCKTFQRVIDDTLEAAARAQSIKEI